MVAKNTHATTGDSSQKQTFDTKTDSHRLIIAPKEARKILGGESKKLSDDDLYRVIIQIERLEKLETIINTKRSELNAKIERLKRQRTISEKSIDRLIGFMCEPARL